jgi:hypothetical protein
MESTQTQPFAAADATDKSLELQDIKQAKDYDFYGFDDESSDLEDNVLNGDLCRKLERKFKPLGIVAFSRCCRMGCVRTYEESPNFKLRREKGVYFIKLHLDGTNYTPNPKHCYAFYDDFAYLIQNWDEELKLLTQFCRIVTGDKQDNFWIEKPNSKSEAVVIFFDKPLKLEPN